MERYVAIDPGKYGTKVAEYFPGTNTYRKFSFLTKASAGDFRDDAIEKQTCIIGYEGNTYKVGAGANGSGAELDTSKLTPLHKTAIIAALAQIASKDEEDEIHVAVGIPALPWHNVETRENAKEYLLPDGKITVSYKGSSTSDVIEKTFIIKTKKVFPESIGALIMYLDSHEESFSLENTYGVLDIGSLNCNATMWTGAMELIADASVTNELGASSLIQKISGELSTRFSRCDSRYVERLLKKKPADRHLVPNNNDQEIIEESHKIIKEILLEHAREIKRACDVKRWSLNYMTLVAIGGTALILEEELKEVFGENIVILDRPTFCNAFGYLETLVSQCLGKAISFEEMDSVEKESAEEAA